MPNYQFCVFQPHLDIFITESSFHPHVFISYHLFTFAFDSDDHAIDFGFNEHADPSFILFCHRDVFANVYLI